MFDRIGFVSPFVADNYELYNRINNCKDKTQNDQYTNYIYLICTKITQKQENFRNNILLCIADIV